MDAADGTRATVGDEHRILQGGNVTDLAGPLYRAVTADRHLWKLIKITGDPDDPKRSPRVSIQWAREKIEKYGRDNPWVLVNVFGHFPPTALNTLLGPDQVSKSMQVHLHDTVYSHEAKILGVDSGRFGGARSVIFPRQDLAGFSPVVLRPDRSQKNWTGAFAARIAQAFDKWHADICFIDDTGGWGSGILDALVSAGYNALGVNFGATALNHRYKNRRVEMYFAAAEWADDGPEDYQLGSNAISDAVHRSGALVSDNERVVWSGGLHRGRSGEVKRCLAIYACLPLPASRVGTDEGSGDRVVSRVIGACDAVSCRGAPDTGHGRGRGPVGRCGGQSGRPQNALPFVHAFRSLHVEPVLDPDDPFAPTMLG